MPERKESFGAAVVSGKIYAIGGYPGAGYYPFSKMTQMYNPQYNTWTILEPMPTRRINFAIGVYDDRIYVIGGQDNENTITTPEVNYQFDVLTGSNEVYDPATNIWQTKTAMSTPRNNL